MNANPNEELTISQQIQVSEAVDTSPEELGWLSMSSIDDVAYAVIANPNVDLRTLRALAEKEQHSGTSYSNYYYDGVAESAEARAVELFGEDWEQYED